LDVEEKQKPKDSFLKKQEDSELFVDKEGIVREKKKQDKKNRSFL